MLVLLPGGDSVLLCACCPRISSSHPPFILPPPTLTTPFLVILLYFPVTQSVIQIIPPRCCRDFSAGTNLTALILDTRFVIETSAAPASTTNNKKRPLVFSTF